MVSDYKGTSWLPTRRKKPGSMTGGLTRGREGGGGKVKILVRQKTGWNDQNAGAAVTKDSQRPVGRERERKRGRKSLEIKNSFLEKERQVEPQGD